VQGSDPTFWNRNQPPTVPRPPPLSTAVITRSADAQAAAAALDVGAGDSVGSAVVATPDETPDADGAGEAAGCVVPQPPTSAENTMPATTRRAPRPIVAFTSHPLS
jgi:hypothetical protein